MDNIIPHPTSILARSDRDKARENLARQLRSNQMMRESARERINAGQIIDEIHELDLKLMGSSTVSSKMEIDPISGINTIVEYEVPIPLEREIISALKARVDIKFRLLSKVLPDLKSTESISHNMHDHHHSHIHQPVSNVELATRLILWQKEIKADKRREPVLIEHEPQEESVFGDTFEDGEYDWL